MGREGSQHNSNQILKNILIGAMICLSQLTQAKETLIDRLVAEVNNQAITYSEVLEKIDKGPLVQVSPYPMTDKASQFQIALHDLINYSLVIQKAEELNIQVPEERLDQEIEKFVRKRELTMKDLKEALKSRGVSFEQYRSDFNDQMILSQFQGRVIYPLVKITDKDIERYYIKKSGNLSENMKVSLRKIHIMVAADANETIRQGKKALAKEVYQKIISGMSFEEAVRIYSDDKANRKDGGLLEDIFLTELAKPFRVAIEPLETTESTAPIETSSGYFLFYLEKKSFVGSSDFQKKKQQLANQLRQEEINNQTIHWLKEERMKSKIRIIKEPSLPKKD